MGRPRRVFIGFGREETVKNSKFWVSGIAQAAIQSHSFGAFWLSHIFFIFSPFDSKFSANVPWYVSIIPVKFHDFLNFLRSPKDLREWRLWPNWTVANWAHRRAQRGMVTRPRGADMLSGTWLGLTATLTQARAQPMLRRMAMLHAFFHCSSVSPLFDLQLEIL